MRRSSLARRVAIGLIGYAVLLTSAVLVHGLVINETAERLVWESLLSAEMEHFLERLDVEPDYLFDNTETLELMSFDLDALPDAGPGALPEGLHDEVPFENRELVVLVRDVDGKRRVLALDISDLEAEERGLAWTIVASAIVVAALMAMIVAWGIRIVIRPIQGLVAQIGRLSPDRSGQQIAIDAQAPAELARLAEAVNHYVLRNEAFVERERAFIDSASHELRTPIAVIIGATEVALGQSDPATIRAQLLHIQQSANGVEQLISLLLVLAKDPARLSSMNDRVSLSHLLPEIVDDHRHLCRDKDLQVDLQPPPECELLAPMAIVQAAIGNLLRNAIENSDRGVIHVRLQPDAVVVIEDPGHGMSPEEISALYRSLARGRRERGGIGLALIGRLCEHLGWLLRIEPTAGRGSVVSLDLGRSRAPSAG